MWNLNDNFFIGKQLNKMISVVYLNDFQREFAVLSMVLTSSEGFRMSSIENNKKRVDKKREHHGR